MLALVTIAIWSRYMRASMLEVISQDYVRTARAKGLPRRRCADHHALRNALLPMITVAGLQLPTLLSGALVTETVFTWPGMGRLFLDCIGYRDYPMVMGMLMFTAVLVLLGNCIADMLYRCRRPAHPAMTDERRNPAAESQARLAAALPLERCAASCAIAWRCSALVTIVLLVLACAFGPQLLPFNDTYIDMRHRFAPPFAGRIGSAPTSWAVTCWRVC